MEQNKNISGLTDRILTYMEKPSKKWYFLLFIMLIFVLIGVYAFFRQVIDGHGITGMRDNVVWGVYIVNFIYLLGLSYAGAMISGIFHLARIQWGKPFIRLIEIFSFVTLFIAPAYILLCIGRLDRLHYLFLYPRLQSPITWDVIAIVTDLIFCIVYLYMTFIKDFHKLKDAAVGKNIPKWRLKMYKVLTFGYNGTEPQKYHLNKAMDIMAAIIIPTAIIAYSLLAWLFGMNLRTGWNSSIFAPYFVLTAVFSGVALLIVIIWVCRKVFKIKDILTDKHIYIFGYILLILSLFFGYFTFSDYITSWYNSELSTSMLMDKIANDFSLMYIITLILSTAIPILIIGLPWFRKPVTIVFTAVLVLFALYLNRYMIIVPVLETPYIPINNPDPAYYNYVPSWIEWALTIAGGAFAVIMAMFITKWVPPVPLSELEEDKKPFKLFGRIFSE